MISLPKGTLVRYIGNNVGSLEHGFSYETYLYDKKEEAFYIDTNYELHIVHSKDVAIDSLVKQTIMRLIEEDKTENRISFGLKDLKCGYVVELRNGKKFMFVESRNGKGFVHNHAAFVKSEDYAEDMSIKYHRQNELDVVKVWGLTKHIGHGLDFDTINRNLLWERNPRVKLTRKQIAAKFGIEVEQLIILEGDENNV